MGNKITVPVWLGYVISGIIICLIVACWWMSLSTYGGNCYDLGKRVERSQNPAKQYIEDGTPFLWYKGTYYRVQYVRPRMFRVLE